MEQQERNAKAETGREQWLDAAKGIGIVVVMIAHGCGIPVLGVYLGACCMCMYFMLAGYTYKEESNRIFFKKKSQRLLIPYMVYGVVAVTIYQIFIPRFTTNEIVMNYVGLLYSRYSLYPYGITPNVYFFRCANSALWFLTAIFMGYMLTQFYYKVKTQWRIGMFFLYLLLTVMLARLPILLPWSVDTAFLSALFMITGRFFRQKGVFALRGKQRWVILLISLALYIPLVYLNGPGNLSVRDYGALGMFRIPIFYITGVTGTLIYAVTSQLLEKGRIISLAAVLGRNTITLLCTHAIIFEMVKLVMKEYASNTYLFTVIAMAISFLVCAGIAAVKKRCSRQIGFVKWL